MKRSQACASPAAHWLASSRSAAYGDPATTSIMTPRRATGDSRLTTRDPRLTTPSFLPQPLPPRDVGRRLIAESRALANVGDVPAGQRGEARHFLLVAAAHLRAIRRRRAAGIAARPGVAQDVASLEVVAIGRFLEDEILREVRV